MSIEIKTEWLCYKCHETKPVTDFYFDESIGFYYRRCKKCDNAINTANKKARGHERSLLGKSHGAVHQALRSGKLIKQPCEKCGETKVHAHHHNGYDQEHWLDVQWLCQKHHKEAHHGVTK